MKIRLYLIFCFNIIDIVSTLYVIQHGGIELNPICAWLLQWPLVFVVSKIAVATLLLILLWVLQEYKVARFASWILFIEYTYIAFYYAFMFSYYV